MEKKLLPTPVEEIVVPVRKWSKEWVEDWNLEYQSDSEVQTQFLVRLFLGLALLFGGIILGAKLMITFLSWL